MSERLGPVAFHTGEEQPFLGREIVQHQRQFRRLLQRGVHAVFTDHPDLVIRALS